MVLILGCVTDVMPLIGKSPADSDCLCRRSAGLDEMLQRSDKLPGYAIGGLSGGEYAKRKPARTLCRLTLVAQGEGHFLADVRVQQVAQPVLSAIEYRILQCASRLPENKPRYSM